MELKVVLDKKDYDSMQKEITDLKELIDTKVITRTDTERSCGGLHGWETLNFITYTKTYTAPKEIIDEINDGIIKSDTAKIKELENHLEVKKKAFEEMYQISKNLEDRDKWKDLNLFRRIFKINTDKN